MIEILTVELSVYGHPRDTDEVGKLNAWKFQIAKKQPTSLEALNKLLSIGYQVVSSSTIKDEIGIFTVTKVVYILHKEG